MNKTKYMEGNNQNKDGPTNIVKEIQIEGSESFRDCNKSIAQESSNSAEAFNLPPTSHLFDLQSSSNSSSTLSWSDVVKGDCEMRVEQPGSIQQSSENKNDDWKQNLLKEEYITIAGVTYLKNQSCSSYEENGYNDRDANNRDARSKKRNSSGNFPECFDESSDSEQEWESISYNVQLKSTKYTVFDTEEAESDEDDSLTESDEEISLFEKSQRFHDNETSNTGVGENFDYQKILNEGLDLSSDYRDKFSDRDPKVLGREPFYSEDCKEKEMYSKLRANPNKYMICSIYIETPHRAYCVPVKSNKKATKIEISGRSKAGQCFTEDEVFVQILNAENTKRGHEKKYGKVLKRVRQHRFKDVQHPVFVCVLDDQAGNLMIPLCKTVPKIHILDSYTKQKYPKHRKYHVDIYKYNKGDNTLHFSDTRLISDDYRESFVFIVVLLTWSRRHIYPLGAVIKVLSKGSRRINASLRVLDAMYRVPYLYGKRTVEHIKCILSNYEKNQQDLMNNQRDNMTHLRAFTIDPERARALDDALSIEAQEECCRVGVHITDVTMFINKNDATDQEARERIETFYSKIRKPRRLLPEPLSESLCSLLPNEKRNCLSVFFDIDCNGEIIRPPSIKSTIIQSHVKLSYLKVQKLLEGETNDIDATIATDVRQLAALSTKLRSRRLHNAIYASRLKDFDEFEAHYLVEEFMVLANKCVTERLLEVYPNQVPLLCLDPPSESTIERWWGEHQSVVHVLLSLQDRSLTEEKKPSLKEAVDKQDGHVIHVSEEFLRVICVQDNINLKLACKWLKVDELHPLQSTALHEWYSMQNKVTYQCSSQLRERFVDGNCFHINGCPYTNFTSPLRRYFDMVVHRLVHCMIKNENCCYTQKEIEDLCFYLNERAFRPGLYKEKCRSLIFSTNLRLRPKLCTCIIIDITDEGIALVALAVDETLRLFLPFKLLVMMSKPKITQEMGTKRIVTTTWRKRLYSTNIEPSLAYLDYTAKREIDPYKEVGFVPVKAWATALIKLVRNSHNEEMTQTFKDMANVVSRMCGAGCENTVRDVSTEDFYDKDMKSIPPYVEFSMSFSCGQTVNVQVSPVLQGGVLTPYPQLFEMTKNIQFCLQHTDDPIKWLYRYSTLRTISTYTDENDYQRRWIPLVKMEAAVDAVGNEESYVINNLSVKFTGNRGQFSLPVRYCQIRNIILNNMDREASEDDEPSGKEKKPIVNLAHDWLCIRSKDSSADSVSANDSHHHNYYYWIAHGKITSVEIREKHERDVFQRTYETMQEGKENAIVDVDFQLHQTVPSILSNTENTYRRKCNIEMLIKSTVDRRTESYLMVLDRASVLAKAIALGRSIPRLDRKHLRESVLSEREVHVAPLHANNQSQRDAIDRTLVSAFSLIQGPPGAGKSYTAVKLIYLLSKINFKIKKGEQVLFCGPSNKSVDNVASWTKKLGDKCPRIARLYGRSIEALEYPIPGADFISKRSMRYLRADDNLHDISVHHLIRQSGKPFAEQIQEFDRSFSRPNYIPCFEEVSNYTKLINKATIEELKHHEVIMCTTGVATSPKLLHGTNIYQLIIDEAGMCPEPQCMATIIANIAKQVILIGDHKQLRPIIKCKSAANLGMSKSLFERYAEDLKSTNYRQNVKYSFLNIQYRMHPELCEFPSRKFYSGNLQTAPQVFTRENENPPLTLWPVPQKPHVLCHVDGSEEIQTVSSEEGNEMSRSNPEEVKQVVRIFKYMVDVEMVDVKDINVISQYNAQCHALRQALADEHYQNCNVNTVVSSQGREWDYVIFSTVRSLSDHQMEPSPTWGWLTQKLGFITDHHQINVALTRAKRGLIIVGNKTLLMCDEMWRSLVKQYEASRCVVTSREFPPRSADIADVEPS
ncbi:hypothetical protein CHS0354_026455 [Potamilus streckersoni]|uniref:RNB domain-containing protein n=1 Tax=Potamilus streckersoni TaxID=2493646 RepID=A0AAE0VH64_9BIVA|nr:hypothetical protein CHS0354_026455 [Potamilus streckersoni]